MLDLADIRKSLELQLANHIKPPCHIGAFVAWIASDETALRSYLDEVSGSSRQMLHPEHVAALGFASASKTLTLSELDLLRDEISHLSGRSFFAPGRPLRFEVDGIALMGVALGSTATDTEQQWLQSLLVRSARELSGDAWQLGLVRMAQLIVGETNLRVVPPDLAVAMAAKGLLQLQEIDLEACWKMTARLDPHESGPARDAVRLTAFEYILEKRGQIAIAALTRDDLIRLLHHISRSMRLWTFEEGARTSRSAAAKWDIENEYHVQNLLWAILAPILSDLENEENLPSLGHKHPRADLGTLSLRTIIEVKFMRNAGQTACAKIIEEIAADASLYLSKSTAYDNIIAFIWDDCAQTEQYDELRSGIEAIKGISAAIILPRPSKMIRKHN